MTGAALGISIATFVLLAANILGRYAFRPRLRVYLPGGSIVAQYPAGNQQAVSLHVKNCGGWLGLRSGVVDNIWATFYLPDKFELQAGVYTGSGEQQTIATAAPQDGRFRGTKYISVGRFSLFKDEVDVVQFTFVTPAQTGQYKAYLAVLSEQGHGGVHTLHLTIA
jgi:hypothetical protein